MTAKILLAIPALMFGVAAADAMPAAVCVADNTANVRTDRYSATLRPAQNDRLFASKAVEREIKRVKGMLKNPKLAWMFENCFPNTIDTTVHHRIGYYGNPDTFVYTGDIHAMWLRDSGAQVWPYVRLAENDAELRAMVEGVIRRQFKCILLDPYANAFNDGPVGGEWQSDYTDMIPEVHERKWEIDSLCYPIRLAYEYWKATTASLTTCGFRPSPVFFTPFSPSSARMATGLTSFSVGPNVHSTLSATTDMEHPSRGVASSYRRLVRLTTPQCYSFLCRPTSLP